MSVQLHAEASPKSGAPATPRVFLEIRLSGAHSVRPVALAGNRQVVGRNPNLAIVLEDESVSRLHGEFVCDPCGRWWIHDLGSTNGTLVNGSKIFQRLLNSGDVVQIGAFTLRYRQMGSDGVDEPFRPTTAPPPVAERRSTQRLQALARANVDATRLSNTIEFGRELAEIEEQASRLTALCKFTVSQRFNGNKAWVIHVDSVGPGSVRVEPVYRSSSAERIDDQQLLALAQMHRAQLTKDPCPQVATWGPASRQHSAVISAIDSHPDGFSALYVEFDSNLFIEEWKHLVGLLVDAYHQANVTWEVRGHVRTGAKVDHELAMARQIQDSLVPELVGTSGLELAIGYEPCQWVGGDYVDAVRMNDGRWLLAVADVCGKGLQAALVASSLHTLVHVIVDESASLPQLVRRMNNYLCRFLPLHTFVTLVCVAIDTRSGLMECVNAGHPPPVVVEPSGKVHLLQSQRNIALGMVETEFTSDTSALCEGDVLFLYTDGLTEAEDASRRILGTDGLQAELAKLVTSLPDANIEVMRRRLTQAMATHRGTLMAHDDTTFLIARLGEEPARGDQLETIANELG